jgi:hypothetical protein
MKLRTKLGAVMVLALILGWIYLMRSPTKPTTKEDLQKSELRMLRKAAERCRDFHDPEVHDKCLEFEYLKVHKAYERLYKGLETGEPIQFDDE